MYVTVKEPGGNTRPPVGKVTDDQLLLIHHIYIPIKTFIRHASLNIKYDGNCLFYVFTTYVVASVLICLSIDKIKSSLKVLNRWTAWHFLVKKINNKHVADFHKQFTKINYIWDQLSFNSYIIPYIPCCFVYWSAILAGNVVR